MAECKGDGKNKERNNGKIEKKYEEKIVSSETLQQELRAEGSDIPDMGLGCACGFNKFSRRDKSWKSLPDFIIQLAKGRRK